MAETKEEHVDVETKLSTPGYLSASDDDDDFDYEQLPESDDDDLEFLGQHDTIASIEQSLRRVDAGMIGMGKFQSTDASSSGMQRSGSVARVGSDADVQTIVRPAVVDDFIRNFFNKMKMYSSLDAFNTEWYELKAKGKLRAEDVSTVPDIYLRNEDLDQQTKLLREELDKMRAIAAKAQSTWDQFRKERNFHRMHHKRVVQEKNKLVTDIKRLKKHFAAYEPTLVELKRKYELAMKEKMLMRLERDRFSLKSSAMEHQLTTLEGVSAETDDVGRIGSTRERLVGGAGGTSKSSANASRSPRHKSNRNTRRKDGNKSSTSPSPVSTPPIPEYDAVNPYADASFEPTPVNNFQLSKTFKGHVNSISAVAFHPHKNILATGSDDETWKLWGMPNGELIMSGEGHESWIASLDFNSRGSHLATASGDGAVKLWDLAQAKCTTTFTEHTQAVWGVTFHYTGDFVASGSMDHTAKLLDVHTGKTRQTLRGHVDAVNSVVFQPFTSNLCTGSGDKTVSLWDVRSGLCIQTFYGHTNACSGVAFNLRGDTIASCDSDGVVKVWDVRMIAERATLSDSRHALNSVSFDPSGEIIAAASDDGTVKMFNIGTNGGLGGTDQVEGAHICNLQGHEDAVQSALFSPQGDSLISGASDCTFRLWNS